MPCLLPADPIPTTFPPQSSGEHDTSERHSALTEREIRICTWSGLGGESFLISLCHQILYDHCAWKTHAVLFFLKKKNSEDSWPHRFFLITQLHFACNLYHCLCWVVFFNYRAQHFLPLLLPLKSRLLSNVESPEFSLGTRVKSPW